MPLFAKRKEFKNFWWHTMMRMDEVYVIEMMQEMVLLFAGKDSQGETKDMVAICIPLSYRQQFTEIISFKHVQESSFVPEFLSAFAKPQIFSRDFLRWTECAEAKGERVLRRKILRCHGFSREVSWKLL